ncbi:MAG: diaminopimelate epimerase [Desulfobacterales bacterium]|jgi:diaminopimelate epimerase|nr:diaminopimelate epimerase [Desulfobacterales bacterium]
MTWIPFFKMSGSGNDFIVIDNRTPLVPEERLAAFVRGVCRRKLSAGADGLILVEDAQGADFRWRFFNSDASPAEMCGNGARCVARFAYLNGIAGQRMTFLTAAGPVAAEVTGKRVKVKMPDPVGLRLSYPITLARGTLTVSSVNTGVPHVVVPCADVDALDVVALGREIRYHDQYAPAGTNVNLVCPRPEGAIAVRTYERGVEDETLACGTGAIAAALVTAALDGRRSPIAVVTRGGETLMIFFQVEDHRYRSIFMEGDARLIYRGELCEEAWI